MCPERFSLLTSSFTFRAVSCEIGGWFGKTAYELSRLCTVSSTCPLLALQTANRRTVGWGTRPPFLSFMDPPLQWYWVILNNLWSWFFQCETTAKHQVMLVWYVIILIINNIGLVDSFSVVSFFVGRKLECRKIHDLSEIVAEVYAAPPFLGAQKGMTPTPFAPTYPR